MKRLCRVYCSLDLAREFLLEMLSRFSEDKAEPISRRVGLRAPLDKADPVIANGLGRLVDPHRSLVPHRKASVQKPVNGCHADSSFAGKIRNRWSLGHIPFCKHYEEGR